MVHSADLVDGTLKINGFQWTILPTLGLCYHKGSVRWGVHGYNEDQVALVVPDSTDFGSQVPVILGTPTINWIINMIKESEIDELSVSLNGLRISHLAGISVKQSSP